MTDERFTSLGGYDRRHAGPVIVVVSLQASQIVILAADDALVIYLLPPTVPDPASLSAVLASAAASETRLDRMAYYGRAMHDLLDRSAFDYHCAENMIHLNR